MAGDDALRAYAIARLMRNFQLDLAGLRAEFGNATSELAPLLTGIADRLHEFVVLTGERLEIMLEGRPLTRIIASALDAHVPESVRYSRAS